MMMVMMMTMMVTVMVMTMMVMVMGTCSLLPARYIWTLIHFFFRLKVISSQSQKAKPALNEQIRATEPDKYGRNMRQIRANFLNKYWWCEN